MRSATATLPDCSICFTLSSLCLLFLRPLAPLVLAFSFPCSVAKAATVSPAFSQVCSAGLHPHPPSSPISTFNKWSFDLELPYSLSGSDANTSASQGTIFIIFVVLYCKAMKLKIQDCSSNLLKKVDDMGWNAGNSNMTELFLSSNM